MMIKDEAMFMRKSGGGTPVMDGLTKWIDGRDDVLVSENRQQWSMLDRVSGEYIQLTGSDCSQWNPVHVDNFLTNEFANVGKWNGFYRILPETGIYSGEIICKSNNSYTSLSSLGSGSTSDLGVHTIFGKYRIRFDWYAFFDVPVNELPRHIMICDNSNNTCSVYIDGIFVQNLQGSIRNRNIVPFNLGTMESRETHGAYVGAIRLYNRALTAEEVLQNYNYEKSLGRVE